MMTRDEKEAFRQIKSTQKLRDLVEKINLDILRGNETIEQMNEVLKNISEQGYHKTVIDAVRNKN